MTRSLFNMTSTTSRPALGANSSSDSSDTDGFANNAGSSTGRKIFRRNQIVQNFFGCVRIAGSGPRCGFVPAGERKLGLLAEDLVVDGQIDQDFDHLRGGTESDPLAADCIRFDGTADARMRSIMRDIMPNSCLFLSLTGPDSSTFCFSPRRMRK